MKNIINKSSIEVSINNNENINKKKIGIYIHIPFCAKKCFYCNFTSFTSNKKVFSDYVKALTSQIYKENFEFIKNIDSDLDINKSMTTGLNFKNITVDTIYIGGGTPSILNHEDIGKILEHVRNKFNVSESAEITIEGNPETLSKDKLEKYASYGINRISIGLQTTNNELLQKIGRIHTFEKFKKVYLYAKKLFTVNIDLMFGLPYQTIEDVKKDLDNILKLNPDSVSSYSLILEESTKLFKNKNKYQFPDELSERKMQKIVKQTLEQNGYTMYEISNFSKPSKESKYNTNVWKQKEYLGYGLGSSSYINSIRFSATDDLNDFISHYLLNKSFNLNKGSIFNINEIQTLEDKYKEHVLLGLRMRYYDTESFYRKYNKDVLELFKDEFNYLKNNNLINIFNKYKNIEFKDSKFKIISLTDKGLDLANQVWMCFI